MVVSLPHIREAAHRQTSFSSAAPHRSLCRAPQSTHLTTITVLTVIA